MIILKIMHGRKCILCRSNPACRGAGDKAFGLTNLPFIVDLFVHGTDLVDNHGT